MTARAQALLGASAFALLMAATATITVRADDNKFAGIDLAPDKAGTLADMWTMDKVCGTKKIKVAYADGWGGNYWRHITRAEFEDEAKKCPNITDVKYTDGEGDAGKHIADIQALVAQHYDVILVFADTGEAVLKELRKATAAGVAVVPFTTGDAPFGKLGVDYVDRASESQIALGQLEAEWMAKTLNGKGNVIVDGGFPGNPMTSSQAVGWKEAFAKYPDIKVLEGPVDTNWDPALAQKVTAAEIAKYPEIDGIIAETDGPIRAFQAAGKPVPAFFGQELNDLSCLWDASNPKFKLATAPAHTWLIRLALRKGVAAAEGVNDTEPSLVKLSILEDSTSTDPKLAVKCAKDLPMDSIYQSSQLSKDQISALLKK
jgi:ribose transport system substrate-binding protein